MVGSKLAKNSHLPDWDFKFTVLDDESINAFTTGGGYVYIHRGIMAYMNSEAELASVLGHEIGHVTARHPAQAQTRGVLASVLATGAAIMTGSSAVAELANIGAHGVDPGLRPRRRDAGRRARPRIRDQDAAIAPKRWPTCSRC